MAKPLKIVLWIAGILILLIAVIAIALPLLFDPNDYREQIAKSVKDATGRDFSFGAIELKVFPWLHVSVHDAALGNAPAFGAEPFAKIGEAGVGVKLMPLLFNHRVTVSTLTLSNLALNLQKAKDGSNNWSDIGRKPEPGAPPPTADGKTEIGPIDIGGVDVKNASLHYADAQGGKDYRVDALSLSTGTIRAGKPFDLKLTGKLASSAPAAALDVELKGAVLPNLETHSFSADDLSLTVKGKALAYDADATLKTKLAADFGAKSYRLDDIDLDAHLAGDSWPGGKQDLGFTGDLVLDQAKGTLALSNAKLKAAGLTVDTTIAGENLNGDAPKLSGPITVASFNPRQWLNAMGTKTQTADADALKEASFSARYAGTFSAARFDDVVLKLDQTTATGSLGVRDFATQALEFALKVDAIDADRYLAPKVKTAANGETDAGKKQNPDDIKLPTETLSKLNANGTVDIGSLKYNGVKMTDVRLKLSGAGDAPREQDVSAKLYGGSFSTTNRISPGQKPQFALKTQLTALNAAPFLQDFLGKDSISGIGDLALDVTGRGDNAGEILRALNGDVSFKLNNGAVKGFNLGQILRKAQAALQGNLAQTENGAQQTDFTTVSASGKIVNGVLHSDQLDGASPALRLAGSGDIDLVRQTIDYLAKPTIVETKTGQGGKGLSDLKGLTIPIHVTGDLFSPKYKVEIDDALKQVAADRLHKEYEKQEDKAKDKLKQRLGDLLFGKPKPAPAAPPPAQPAPAPKT